MIKGKEIQIVRMNISEISEYRNKLRKNEAAVKAMVNSIQSYGMNDPIIVDENKVILAGHTRLNALKRIGVSTAPVVIVDWLSEKEKSEFRIAHNSISQIAEWDLKNLQAEIDKFNLELINYGLEEQIREMKKLLMPGQLQEVESPQIDDSNKATIVKKGEIWLLGDHRLMCDDCTDEKTVKKLMREEKADLLLTDPPYNVNYEGATKEKLTIQNDNMEESEFHKFLQTAFKNADSVMRNGASFYIWHADSEGFNFRSACKLTGWKIRQCLIWVKNSIVLGRQDYQWKHEPCLYGWKDGSSHYFVDDRTQSTIWEFNKPIRNSEHPTMKPVELMAKAVNNSSRKGNIVLDIFGGSGSTLIACEQLGRRCYTMEIDPKYCDVIIKRWEMLTGKQAKKIEG